MLRGDILSRLAVSGSRAAGGARFSCLRGARVCLAARGSPRNAFTGAARVTGRGAHAGAGTGTLFVASRKIMSCVGGAASLAGGGLRVCGVAAPQTPTTRDGSALGAAPCPAAAAQLLIPAACSCGSPPRAGCLSPGRSTTPACAHDPAPARLSAGGRAAVRQAPARAARRVWQRRTDGARAAERSRGCHDLPVRVLPAAAAGSHAADGSVNPPHPPPPPPHPPHDRAAAWATCATCTAS